MPYAAFVFLACSRTPNGGSALEAKVSPEAGAEDPVSDAGPSRALPDRPADDVARDADRKPRQVLEFFGIREGHRVVELQSGRGYYVDLLARAVGPTGRVWAHNSPFVLKRYAEEPISRRLASLGVPYVERLNTELDDPRLPDGIDAVLIILFYHDTFWQKVDRARMNAAIFAALAPGGVFGVIDHHAQAGSGDRDVKSLHRVDADLVKREVLAAGFELDDESDLLRRPDDDRTVNVFDAGIRGQTDRFVLRFRKPR